MNSMADIMREIGSTFGISQPEVARICSAIVDYLSQQPTNRRLHLTYTLLKREAVPESDSELIAAIQYLTGAKADLLEMKYEFMDEEGDYHPLAKSVVASAQKQNSLQHPVTGEMVQDYQSSLLVYFTPTDRVRSCLQEKGA